MPLPHRWLTSLMARYNGQSILIDCGEGTQIAMKEKGWSPKPIDVICFTHFHADHISGLPGMLLTMGNAERTEPLLLIGPRGLLRVVNSLRIIAPELPFEVICLEITEPEQVFPFREFRIRSFRVNHNVPCYGYSIEIDRAGKFDLERAQALNIPRNYWNPLQKGEIIDEDGYYFTPDMVLGEPRRGLKVTYCTDTRPTEGIVKNASGADLFICEGMYGEPDKAQKAKEYKHMTFYEAAEIARRAGVEEMWLTHYSPSLIRPEDYMPEVRKISRTLWLQRMAEAWILYSGKGETKEGTMKNSKVAKTIIIVAALAAIILVYYYSLSHRAKRQEVEETIAATVVQSILMRDLEHNYPPTPKEVVKYYAEITECFYNETYSDEELVQLAGKIQMLYDAELVANKTQEQYMQDLRDDIAEMKGEQLTVASYEVSSSTDVEYFEQGEYSCARLYCTFYLKKQGGSRVPSQERFVLRQDGDGHWKILGWELVED